MERVYTESLEWLEVRDGQCYFGLSKRLLEQLEEIVYISLVDINTSFLEGDPIAVVESTKAAIDIPAPVDGVIVRRNEELLQNISLLHEDPEGAGWLFIIDQSPAQSD